MAQLKLSVLVVDDDPGVLRILKRDLEEIGCDVTQAGNGEMGLQIFSEHSFDLVLVDLRMPGLDGFEVMRQLKDAGPDVPVVVMTGHGSVDAAVGAMKAGATEFLTKPIDEDHLKVVVDRIATQHRQSTKLRLLEEQVVQHGTFEEMVGVSPAMQQVYNLVRRVATRDATVLIQCETGTGKELVAKGIHNQSARCDKPFVAVNCGALTESLLENELFGHERGAFTGALAQKIGLVEQADGGTLFLDEVEAMSPGLQTRLLRVIQDKLVRRVGGLEDMAVDFRLLAAANQNLKGAVDTGAFRSDLYFRLQVVNVTLPPLRTRHTDIPLLVYHFVAKWCQENNCNEPEITPEAMMALRSYEWPGNVRELENMVIQLLVFNHESKIGDAK